MTEKTIKTLLNDAYAAIHEAEKLADRTGQTFEFSLRYGMGGTYFPTKPKPVYTKRQALDLLSSGQELSETQRQNIVIALDEDANSDDGWHSSHEGWVSSSDQC